MEAKICEKWGRIVLTKEILSQSEADDSLF